MAAGKQNISHTKKRERAIDRESTTALYLLRAVSLGISIADMSNLSMGMIVDMYIERANDNYDYPQLATQEDIDRL